MQTQMIASDRLVLLVLIPLVGSLLAYAAGFVRKELSGWIATAAAAGAAVLAVRWLFRLPAGAALEQHVFTWMHVGDVALPFSLPFTLRFDHLTAVMCAIVTGVGSLIHLYAIGYMHGDPGRPRFFAYMNLFLFAMLLLVLGGNLVVLFAGWEGVGLCSYLLIGFWFKNSSFAAAGRKAFVVNRIGDAGFLLGMFLLLTYTRTLDFAALQGALNPSMPLLLIAICLFIGAVGKSAQIPLFVWLPDAMAGPTPVSALIHAATMVTAGVYLVCRMHFLYSAAPGAQTVIVLIAVATALVAASIAVTQYDVKKVLAYSTVSQLGFMFAAAGVGAYEASLFHVVTHAFFKACLFMCAGSLILGCHHEQDLRRMGGLARAMPWTFAAYAISTLSIAGIYPFAGYFSKHAITEAVGAAAIPQLLPVQSYVNGLLLLTAALTAFYMTRSLVMAFAGQYRGEGHPHEAPAVMVAPVLALAALAAVAGVLLGSPLSEYLNDSLPAAHHHASSALSSLVHSWPGALGITLAALLYLRFHAVPARIKAWLAPFSTVVERRYFVDELYAAFIIAPLQGTANILARIFDQKLIDGTVEGTAVGVNAGGELMRKSQAGDLRIYALFLFIATVALLALLLVGRA